MQPFCASAGASSAAILLGTLETLCMYVSEDTFEGTPLRHSTTLRVY